MIAVKAKTLAVASLVIAAVAATGYYLTQPPEGLPDCYKKLVCDSEHLFTSEQVAQLSEYHKALLEQYDIDLRVFTGQNFSPSRSVTIFKVAQIGENSKTRKGLLLSIDPKMDYVRLEVSAGLDAVYTDGFVAYIQQRQMVPFFQASQVANGILATTEMIVTRAQEAQVGKQFMEPQQLPQNLAIGAGAQGKASIGSGAVAAQASAVSVNVKQGLKPEEIVGLYHKALRDGNTAYDLPIYAPSTQELRKTWVVTPAQMKNELEAYKKCDIDQTIILKEVSLAVVRYKADQRHCAPYFLRYENGGWKLDFVTMMHNVKFNVSNEWHFDMKKPLQYADAFLDWDFNKDGYPFARKIRWGITISTDFQTGITTISGIGENVPAASMDIREGDRILSWDGIKNANHKQIRHNLDTVPAGKLVKVEIIRDGKPMTVTLTAPPI